MVRVLVSNFKMIGMLLNVMRGQVQKSQQKTYNNGFPNYSALITMMWWRHQQNLSL